MANRIDSDGSGAAKGACVDLLLLYLGAAGAAVGDGSSGVVRMGGSPRGGRSTGSDDTAPKLGDATADDLQGGSGVDAASRCVSPLLFRLA